jgi:hypothetical protein
MFYHRVRLLIQKTSGVWYGKLLAKAKPKFKINRAMARRPARIALQDMKRTGSPIVSQTLHLWTRD